MDENQGFIKDLKTGFGEGGAHPESFPAFPLTIVALAELNPRGLCGVPSAPGKARIGVDRFSFAEVMRTFDLRLTVAVPDRVGRGDDPLILEIPLPGLKAFRPENVAGHIPALSGLLALQGHLEALRQSPGSWPEIGPRLAALAADPAVPPAVRQALAGPGKTPPAPLPATPSPAAGLDGLLAQIDAPTGSSPGAGLASLDSLIRDLLRSAGQTPTLDSKAVTAALQATQEGIALQTREVTLHPEFRRLEAAWRGLKFLLDRADPDKGIRVEVVAAARESLLETFDEVIYGPESAGISPEPIGFILADFTFRNAPADLELLQALAQRAAALSAPLIASAGPGLLGLDPGQAALPEGLRQRFGADAFAKWRGLRESGPSRWLGLVFNRFLLREGLWGDPAWGLAALAAKSFARTGWCTDFMGQRPAGTLEDLPLGDLSRTGGDPVPFPLEFLIKDQHERDLNEAGIMTLSAAPGADKAFLRFAPTVHTPRHYPEPLDKAKAKLQSTLPFQMFVGRVINFALLIERQVVPGRSGEQIAAAYTAALRGLIGTAGAVPGDAVRVEVLPGEQDSSASDLRLNLRWPGFQSLPGAGDFELRWPLAGS